MNIEEEIARLHEMAHNLQEEIGRVEKGYCENGEEWPKMHQERPIGYNLYFIRENMPQEEVLAQLIEECGELILAASKLRRILLGKVNPTPITQEEANDNLIEEIADVRLALKVYGIGESDENEIMKIMERKADRWAKRLKDGKA